METIIVCKVILVDELQQILLLKRSETDTRRPLQWDIPGGQSEAAEFAEEAAARETQEEAGIIIGARELRQVYTCSKLVPSGKNVNWIFYIAKVAQPSVSISYEHAEYKWTTLDEALGMIDYDIQKQAFQYIKDNQLL
jgi:8-oxo-dGTP pyrophosphatase MutT (NUDIX family)